MNYICPVCKKKMTSKEIDNFMNECEQEFYIPIDNATEFDEFVYCCIHCKEEMMKRDFIINNK